MTDELRERLARIDPLPRGPGDPPFGAAPPLDLLEAVMHAPTDSARTTSHRRGLTYALVGAAAAAALGIGVAVVAQVDDPPSATPLALDLGGAALASCMVFDPAFLAEMPVAFEGTAVEVGDGTVTLDVERWYTGGDAETVELLAPAGLQALIDGIEFEAGQTYLITATEGQVNYCGYSGVATDELRAAFDQAFAA